MAPHRFRTKQQFWTYCGLAIVKRSRSDWAQSRDGCLIPAHAQQTRGFPRQLKPKLKGVFKAAATTAITQQNKDPIQVDYQRMPHWRIKPNPAKLTLARKIGTKVLRMYKDEDKYQSDNYSSRQTPRFLTEKPPRQDTEKQVDNPVLLGVRVVYGCKA